MPLDFKAEAGNEVTVADLGGDMERIVGLLYRVKNEKSPPKHGPPISRALAKQKIQASKVLIDTNMDERVFEIIVGYKPLL